MNANLDQLRHITSLQGSTLETKAKPMKDQGKVELTAQYTALVTLHLVNDSTCVNNYLIIMSAKNFLDVRNVM